MMSFEADTSYDLLVGTEVASTFDSGQDRTGTEIRAVFARTPAVDIAPVPLPAPGLLLVAGVIGLGVLRSRF